MSPRNPDARLACAIAGLALALLLASPLHAQELTNSFGGLSESSDEPIDIESDLLTVYDAKKYATFKGNVKAVQGTTTLRASELDVHYVGDTNKLTGRDPAAPATPANAPAGEQGKSGEDSDTQINKIEARGNVVITSEDDQTTTSDWALYDVPSQIVTVGGNVVLTQGQNVLKGDRLVIDLKTGESRFENTGNTAAGGRIRALFMPKGDEEGGDKPAGAKTGDAKAGEAKAGDAKAAGAGTKAAGAEAKPKPAKRAAKAAGETGDQPPASEAPADDEPISLVPEYR
jgi:lipopolysaccharide export system protein LptA